MKFLTNHERSPRARRNGCRREEDHDGQLTNKSQANTDLQFQKTK